MTVHQGAGPLSGRTVVVTRASGQADHLVHRLQELGAAVVELPLIATLDPDDGGAALADALARLDEVDWLVVTSPNGARRVAAALAGRPHGAPLVAAVGTATAAALGRPADLVPDRQVAEGLLDAFPAPTGRATVLLAQADAARPDLADGLAARGWHVRTVVAYRTAVAPPELTEDPGWQAVRERALAADAVVFTSGSSARGWRLAVGARTPPVVAAIGPVTADAARQEGLKVTTVATDHSIDGLVAALAAVPDAHWQS